MLFLYTDGVTEAENPSKELYSDARFKDVLATAGGSARDVVECVKSNVDIYAAGTEQSDDITILCLKYNATDNCVNEVEKELHLVNELSEIAKLPLLVGELAS